MTASIHIGSFIIDRHCPVMIVAELSANHNGSLDIALETIRAAKRAGADAIKFQTYTADTITLNARSGDFLLQEGSPWAGKYLYDLYKEAYTPWEWHPELFEAAHAEGLICFSSPFDKSAVDLLESLDTPAYKIASFEITDIPLIRYAASKRKPMIISTGIAGEEDIRLAVEACRDQGNQQIILLKCTSGYPAPINEANICMVEELAERFGVFSGLSDHTEGIAVPVVATAFGARMIEKHLILSRSLGGPDATFSLEEKEFSEMVRAVRDAEAAIGRVDYGLTDKMKESRKLSRSLYAVEDLHAGDVVTEKNVRSIRPGNGLHPRYLDTILGKRATMEIQCGTPLKLEYFE